LSSAKLRTQPAKPFLKWAGGKSQLLSQFDALYPAALKQGKIKRYIEPFVGGGAVFFDLAQKYQLSSAFLFDLNPELILTYKVVRNYPEQLVEQLEELSRSYKLLSEQQRQTFYYELRDRYNRQRVQFNYNYYSADWISRAAMLVFLNRTCFNGLFRLNRKGEFNVPHGKYKNPKIVDRENLMAASQVLQIAEIETGDFEACKKVATAKSFIYFDPPYRPISKTASFTSYAKENFDDLQQARLANFFRQLHENLEVKMMLSNSDPKNENPTDNFFEDLYQGFHLHRVSAHRAINSNAQKRGQIYELAIANYPISP